MFIHIHILWRYLLICRGNNQFTYAVNANLIFVYTYIFYMYISPANTISFCAFSSSRTTAKYIICMLAKLQNSKLCRYALSDYKIRSLYVIGIRDGDANESEHHRTWWHGNVFCITSAMCSESTGHLRIRLTKGQKCEALIFPFMLARTNY